MARRFRTSKKSGDKSQNRETKPQNQSKDKGAISALYKTKPFSPSIKSVTADQIHAEEEGIRKFNEKNQIVCKLCGRVITDISTAMRESETSEDLVHFDCVLQKLAEKETLESGDKIAYIGQGRFGIIHMENPAASKKFTIKKIIDWESKEPRNPIRSEMADLYSTIK